jgi:hypothetical protein
LRTETRALSSQVTARVKRSPGEFRDVQPLTSTAVSEPPPSMIVAALSDALTAEGRR